MTTSGRTITIDTPPPHIATVIWLQDIGRDADSAKRYLIGTPSIKFIILEAPQRPTRALGGLPFAAWLDVGADSLYCHDDIHGLDFWAQKCAEHLSTESPNVKLGIGGFGMGAAVALYSAQCFAMGRFANGLPYPPITLDFVIGFSGWLPFSGTLKSRMESVGPAARWRAAHLKILLLHGDDDAEVPYETSMWSAEFLRTSSFSLDFRTFNGLGHFWTWHEMNYLKEWLRRTITVPRVTVPTVFRRHGRL